MRPDPTEATVAGAGSARPPVAASPRWRQRRSPPGTTAGGGVAAIGGSAAGEKAGACCGHGAAGGGGLPGDRAGHRIQPLFQHGDAGIQPVAIAVQGLDGGSQPPRLAVALLGDGLDLLGLARQIGGRDLVAPPAQRGLVGEHRQRSPQQTVAAPHDPSRHSARRSKLLFLAKNPDSTPPVFSVSKSHARWSRILGHTKLPAPPRPRPNHRANINRKCARILNPPRRVQRRIGFPWGTKTL